MYRSAFHDLTAHSGGSKDDVCTFSQDRTWWPIRAKRCRRQLRHCRRPPHSERHRNLLQHSDRGNAHERGRPHLTQASTHAYGFLAPIAGSWASVLSNVGIEIYDYHWTLILGYAHTVDIGYRRFAIGTFQRRIGIAAARPVWRYLLM